MTRVRNTRKYAQAIQESGLSVCELIINRNNAKTKTKRELRSTAK